MEWIHEGLPPPNSCAEVWLGGSSVRKVQRDCMGDLQFTDCTHPMQNICCAKQAVMAWRPRRRQAVSLFRGQRRDVLARDVWTVLLKEPDMEDAGICAWKEWTMEAACWVVDPKRGNFPARLGLNFRRVLRSIRQKPWSTNPWRRHYARHAMTPWEAYRTIRGRN